jgi:ABC-type Mn2+/Zn2+ transport system ATPase subunit
MTATSIPARLETDHLSIHFEDRPAIEDIHLTLFPGEIVSLVGPNGAGKSTLLKALAGILPASHGSVKFNGTVIQGPESCVVYVPQRSTVDWSFPISVIDVVLMALRGRRSRFVPFARRDRHEAHAALARVGMDELSGVQISQLSGGQQQRVFLARALLAKGEVYLLDEPFTGVDAPTQELLTRIFENLRSQGKTVVSATHDLEQAAETSSRVVILNRRVIADGPPDVVLTPEVLGAAYGGQFRVLSRIRDQVASR